LLNNLHYYVVKADHNAGTVKMKLPNGKNSSIHAEIETMAA